MELQNGNYSLVKRALQSEMKSWITLLIALATSLFGLTVGYSYSQSKLAEVVAVHESRLTAIEKRADEIQRANSDHMKAALDSWDRQMEVQKEFIATIRLQNELLLRQRNERRE